MTNAGHNSGDRDEAMKLLALIVKHLEWNGRRHGWDLHVSLPVGTITKVRDLLGLPTK